MRAALLGVLILSGMMSLAARASHYSLNCSNPKGTVTYNVLGPVIKLHTGEMIKWPLFQAFSHYRSFPMKRDYTRGVLHLRRGICSWSGGIESLFYKRTNNIWAKWGFLAGLFLKDLPVKVTTDGKIKALLICEEVSGSEVLCSCEPPHKLTHIGVLR